MRFAVHRPGIPEASPRSHGVPRRDVDGRVHVRVADETAGSAPEDGLALTRVPVHLPARRAPLTRVMRLDLLHPARRLLPPVGAPAAPTPTPRSPGSAPPWPGRCGRDHPAYPWRTGSCSRSAGPRPGSPRTAARCRCWTSRPSLCAGRSPGAQPGDRVPDPAAAVRAPLRAGQPALQPPQPPPLPPGQAGAVQQLAGRQGRARPRRPGQCPRPRPLPGAGIGRGITAKATCQRPARSMVTR